VSWAGAGYLAAAGVGGADDVGQHLDPGIDGGSVAETGELGQRLQRTVGVQGTIEVAGGVGRTLNRADESASAR
jgi:hypothetical protein